MEAQPNAPDGQASVQLRPVKAADQAFIFSNWLYTYRDGDAVRNVPDKVYFDEMHQVIEGFLKHSRTVMLVDRDTDCLFGFITYDVLGAVGGRVMVLHYAYLKKGARHQGLAEVALKRLLELEEPALVWYTHRTGSWRHFLARHDLGKESSPPFVYNPFLVWRKPEETWTETSRALDALKRKP